MEYIIYKQKAVYLINEVSLHFLDVEDGIKYTAVSKFNIITIQVKEVNRFCQFLS